MTAGPGGHLSPAEIRMRYLPSRALSARPHRRPRRRTVFLVVLATVLVSAGITGLILAGQSVAAAWVLLAFVAVACGWAASAPARRRRRVRRDCSKVLDQAIHDLATTGIRQIEEWLRHPTR
jgi:hypothetical protein